jgi:hypothetical protein
MKHAARHYGSRLDLSTAAIASAHHVSSVSGQHQVLAAKPSRFLVSCSMTATCTSGSFKMCQGTSTYLVIASDLALDMTLMIE